MDRRHIYMEFGSRKLSGDRGGAESETIRVVWGLVTGGEQCHIETTLCVRTL